MIDGGGPHHPGAPPAGDTARPPRALTQETPAMSTTPPDLEPASDAEREHQRAQQAERRRKDNERNATRQAKNRAACSRVGGRRFAWWLAEEEHGTEAGYTNQGCQCDACTDAGSKASAARKGGGSR